MTECFECGEKLSPDQEWRLRPDLLPDKEAQGDDFIHEKCLKEYVEKLEYTRGGLSITGDEVNLPVVAKVAWADSTGDIEAFHVEDPDKVFPEVQSGDLLVRKKDAEKRIRRLKKKLEQVKSE